MIHPTWIFNASLQIFKIVSGKLVVNEIFYLSALFSVTFLTIGQKDEETWREQQEDKDKDRDRDKNIDSLTHWERFSDLVTK